MRHDKLIDIAKGASRTVLLIGDFAFKIPRATEWRLFLRGLLANMQELEWYSKTRHTKLCPIVFSIPLGFCVCMRRARPMLDRDWEIFDTSAYIENLPVEQKIDSFGWLDGNIVVVDYGS